MSTPSDDAQRDLEQRALRNVRGLVDKVENIDLADKRSERRMLKWLAIIALVVFAGIAAYLGFISNQRASGATVTIEPKR
jgi:hypothetical protein